ncbi:MAG: TIM barrel protein [Nanoarchaeota archaeon]
MVEFGTGYAMPMDREYGQHAHQHDSGEARSSPADNSTNDVGVGIKDLGMSIAMGPVQNIHAVGAKLRAGMKTMEIGFIGRGKGSGQQPTPEYIGKAQRRALEELGKANEVNFTTHASFGITGLAGMDQRGNFNKAVKEESLHEIKRAVEFAGDVAHGGPVVVHTGEFHRSLVGAEWNQEGEFSHKFRMHEKEQERETFGVVDTRDGSLKAEAHKNRKVSRPEWLTAKAGQEYEGLDGKKRVAKEGEAVYLDYWDKQVPRNLRVPVYKNGEFVSKQYGWEELQEQAEEMANEAREDLNKWKRASAEERKEIEKKSPWARFLREDIDAEKIKIRPEEAYLIAGLETQAGHARGYAYNFSSNFQENVEMVRKLRKALDFYQKIEETTDPEERWKLKRQVGDLVGGLVPEDAKMPTEIIERNLKNIERQMKSAQEGAASQFAQAEEQMESIKYVQSAETYALQEAYDSYAQAGISAMRQSKKMEEMGKLKKPIAIAMENLWPEQYGSHPDEIMDLVLSSRQKMASILKEKYNLSEKEAKAKAEAHITATIDTGHINMWRKYWIGDHHKSIEDNDQDFNQWVVKKMGEMVTKKVVGHIHLDDNFGYNDEHLAPGEGNAPITEMMKALKDNGYKGELIVEPGADFTTDLSGFHSVMKTWKLFGSSVYGAGSGVRGRGWGDVTGYMGMTQPPYFVFGSYSPSEDWTLWSGVQLE